MTIFFPTKQEYKYKILPLRIECTSIKCNKKKMCKNKIFYLKTIGISPDDTAQVTCARPPSCKFFGNLNGSITGGADGKIQRKAQKF